MSDDKTPQIQAPTPENPDVAADAKFDDVPVDSVLEEAVQANKDADERPELDLAWNELIETGVLGITRETFLTRLNQRFHIDIGPYEVQLQLVEVERLADDAHDLGDGAPDSREHFRAVFRGASQRAALPEGIYRLEHEEIGQVEIYLRPTWRPTPAGQPQDLPHLEATFN